MIIPPPFKLPFNSASRCRDICTVSHSVLGLAQMKGNKEALLPRLLHTFQITLQQHRLVTPTSLQVSRRRAVGKAGGLKVNVKKKKTLIDWTPDGVQLLNGCLRSSSGVCVMLTLQTFLRNCSNSLAVRQTSPSRENKRVKGKKPASPLMEKLISFLKNLHVSDKKNGGKISVVVPTTDRSDRQTSARPSYSINLWKARVTAGRFEAHQAIKNQIRRPRPRPRPRLTPTDGTRARAGV